MQRQINFLNSYGLPLATVICVLWAASVFAASMAIRECPPATVTEPNVLPPCKTRREPMTMEQCEDAKAAWQTSGSLEAAVTESGIRQGYTIRLVCEGDSYSFTVPEG